MSATGAVRSRYTGQSERRVGEMSIEACRLVIVSISGTLYTLSTCGGPWHTVYFRDYSESEICSLLRAHVTTTRRQTRGKHNASEFSLLVEYCAASLGDWC